jgi:hypothetical protein
MHSNVEDCDSLGEKVIELSEMLTALKGCSDISSLKDLQGIAVRFERLECIVFYFTKLSPTHVFFRKMKEIEARLKAIAKPKLFKRFFASVSYKNQLARINTDINDALSFFQVCLQLYVPDVY